MLRTLLACCLLLGLALPVEHSATRMSANGRVLASRGERGPTPNAHRPLAEQVLVIDSVIGPAA